MSITINGSTGISMASDDSLSFGDVGLSKDTLFSGRKNIIINGDMKIYQRGGTQSTSGYGSVDRWRIVSDGTVSALHINDVVNGRRVGTFSSTASGQTYHVIQQRIEYMRFIQGRTYTLSAWVKGTAGTHTQYFEFRNASGTVQNSETFNITYTGAWQFVEHTFTAPTNAAQYDNDTAWWNVSFYGGASLAITMVQIEPGSQATAFEYRSHGEELALCQRYYEKSYVDGTPPATATSANAIYCVSFSPPNQGFHETVYLKERKRVTPTVTFYSPQTGSSGVCYNASAGADTAMTTGGYNSTSAFLAYAPLPTVGQAGTFHYTADAEL